MRTVTVLIEVEAVADSSESRITEAVVAAIRSSVITPPGVGFTTTEDGQRVRIRDVREHVRA